MPHPQLELYLQAVILPLLESGRPGWDKPHTESVVAYAKKIFEQPEVREKLDYEVLLIAAYAHDWGYVGLFSGQGSLNLDDVKRAKIEHMHRSSEKLSELLKRPFFDWLTPEQKKRAIHLVRIHDKIERLEHPDELSLMEADTLGALEAPTAGHQFDQASNERYLDTVLSVRYPRFITAYGKDEFERLWWKRWVKSHLPLRERIDSSLS